MELHQPVAVTEHKRTVNSVNVSALVVLLFLTLDNLQPVKAANTHLERTLPLVFCNFLQLSPSHNPPKLKQN